MKPFKLAARYEGCESTMINVLTPDAEVNIGTGYCTIIAGPCAVESREKYISLALTLKDLGVHILRGGAFKPRTSPYSFAGLGQEGLSILAEARDITGLPVCTEVMDARDLDMLCDHTDIIQIGSRNMQNFVLLKEVGRTCKPVLLKRGLSATIEEWLLAAEYILNSGNHQVILCERGIRTFEPMTRNTADISAVALARELSHLPVIVDPSHATGHWSLVTPVAKAAIAAGADGLMIEVHAQPEQALSDGHQSLTPAKFALLYEEIEKLAGVENRVLN